MSKIHGAVIVYLAQHTIHTSLEMSYLCLPVVIVKMGVVSLCQKSRVI